MDLSTVVLVDTLVSGELTFGLSSAEHVGCSTGGIFKSELHSGAGSGVSRVHRRSLRLRRYVLPLHSTVYDLSATWLVHNTLDQTFSPGSLRRTTSPGCISGSGRDTLL